jgi:parallel beta-helix repeat protein
VTCGDIKFRLTKATAALCLALALGPLAFGQAVTFPGQPIGSPNQISVTTTYLYSNKVHYAGAWSSTATYNSQDLVTYGGVSYVSLLAGNLNQNPFIVTAYWAAVASIWPGTISGPNVTLPGTLTAGMLDTGGQVYNVRAYGAKCDGVTNDAAAFAAAIAAAPVYGGTVYFDGSCYLQGTGTELILLNKPVSLIGSGTNSKLLVFGSSTTNVIHIAPPANATYLFYYMMLQEIRGFSIEPQSSPGVAGASCQDAIAIDPSANDMWFLTVRNVRVYSPGTNGYAISVRNGSAHTGGNTLTNGGLYLAKFEGNQLYNGIFLNNVGDSIYIKDNEITNLNAGVYVSQVSGAAGLTISGNNITSQGGCIVIDSGIRPLISNNECENNVTNTNGSMIDLRGAVNPITSATVELNSINPDTHSQGGVIPIKIEAATGTSLRRNSMSQSGTQFAIVNTAH